MKSVWTYSLFIALMLTSAVFAQEFQLGMRLEARYFNTNTENVPDPSIAVSSLQIFGTAILNETTGLEARLGLDGNNFYEGREIGILSKYYLNDFYAVGGIVYHHMTGWNNTRDNWSTVNGDPYGFRPQDLFLPALGFGYSPVKHFCVELLIQNGLNKKVGSYDDWSGLITDNIYNGYPPTYREIKLTWLVNLGVSYSFNL
ncbi:MAG: hypothetical protein ACM3Q2_00755 [Syntrophothermus sp.]